MNLNDIPCEVYIEYIIKYIGLKEVGALAIVSKTLKEIFEKNEIWKHLYIRTTPLKILDTSKHIGIITSKTDIKKQNEIKPVYWTYYNNINQSGLSLVKDSCTCYKNIDKYLSLNIEPLSKVIQNASLLGIHNRINSQTEQVKKDYHDYIRNLHIMCNKNNKLSIKNLCQNINHYDIDTLGNIGNNIISNSYKKLTLKKLNTDRKKKVKSYEYKLKIKRGAIKRIQKELDDFLEEEKKLELNQKKINNFIKKSKITFDILNKREKGSY